MYIFDTQVGDKVAVRLADIDWFEKIMNGDEMNTRINIGEQDYTIKRTPDQLQESLSFAQIKTTKYERGDGNCYVINANVTHIVRTGVGTSSLRFRSGSKLVIQIPFPPKDLTGE